MQIYMTAASKAANSTKRLSFTGLSPYQCTLKTPTSIERPVITLSTFVPNAHYAWIPSFGRCYFVEDIVCAHNQTFVYYLTIDALGSYRDQIRGLSLLCTRSNLGSSLLSDSYVTHTADQITIRTEQDTMYIDAGALDFSVGSYILTTVGGGSSSGFGSTTLYIVSAAQMNILMEEIFNPSSSIYGGEMTDDMVKTYFRPFDYIISCKWTPITVSQSGAVPIKFGFWTATATGVKLSQGSTGAQVNVLITIPLVNGNNFTSYNPNWIKHDLFVPGFGSMPIDPKYSGKPLVCQIFVDFATGAANMDVCLLRDTLPYPVISTLTGQWCVPVQLSQLSVDASNIATNIIAGTEYTANAMGLSFLQNFGGKGSTLDVQNAAVLGMASSLISKVPLIGKLIDGGGDAMAPTLTSCGTNGNKYYFSARHTAYIITSYYPPDNMADIQTKYNLPDDKIRDLSTLSGYAVCLPEKAVDIGTASENTIIMTALTGGVYLE